MADRLQKQRFEQKYIVDERVAFAIRDFLGSYLELDEYGATQPLHSYPVHTLYLDSPDLILYQKTINGEKNRFKLRLRFYENGDDSPVYAEIKRRVNNVIQKRRAAVRREAVRWILAGHCGADFLHHGGPEDFAALDAFCTLLNRLGARPQVHVSYLREAWMSQASDSVRVTIDRQVRSEPRKELSLRHEMSNPIHVFRNGVVLELKFTDRYPNWFRELVQAFGLRQGSAAKYVDGVVRMGERGILSGYL
jgi:SPX domain protein involved in polyphosphate accumulation